MSRKFRPPEHFPADVSSYIDTLNRRARVLACFYACAAQNLFEVYFKLIIKRISFTCWEYLRESCYNLRISYRKR